ncbi:MAG: aminotransferase class V-fold PLP-dependent enzyme, partial [Patescibacteria group bacterium]
MKKLTHSSKKRKEIYLDYSASSPMDKRVLEAMKPYFSVDFGNAGSLHSFGQRAQAGIDVAREIVAGSLGAKFNEIIFTGSASEANNLAIR